MPCAYGAGRRSRGRDERAAVTVPGAAQAEGG
jgi:hypothetical protein